MIPVAWCRSYTEACLELNELLALRFNDDPVELGSLTMKVVPCMIEGFPKPGKMLVAWPSGEGPTAHNFVGAYFGDHPAPAFMR